MKHYTKKQFSEMKQRLQNKALYLNTKPHTARAASDKFVVEEQSTKDKIWWGVYNRPFTQEKFTSVMARAKAFCRGKNCLFRMLCRC